MEESNWYEVTYYITGVGRRIRETVLAVSGDAAVSLVVRKHSVPSRCYGHWASAA